MTKEYDCPKTIPCIDCEGDGRVLMEFTDTESSNPVFVSCGTCGGTGEVACPQCGGSGKAYA